MKKKSEYETFVSFIKDYFKWEYINELDDDFKDGFISLILMNNHRFISREFVQENDFCNQCGWCCKRQGCFRLIDNLCSIHDDRYQQCRDWPWGEVSLALNTNCAYAIKIVIKYIDEQFEKIIKAEKKGD